MKECEAIRELEWAKNRLMQNNHMDNNRIVAFNMACDALEKQIPKKIVKHDKCPVCNNNQSTTWYYVGSSYCEFCGQKLNWDNTK